MIKQYTVGDSCGGEGVDFHGWLAGVWSGWRVCCMGKASQPWCDRVKAAVNNVAVPGCCGIGTAGLS